MLEVLFEENGDPRIERPTEMPTTPRPTFLWEKEQNANKSPDVMNPPSPFDSFSSPPNGSPSVNSSIAPPFDSYSGAPVADLSPFDSYSGAPVADPSPFDSYSGSPIAAPSDLGLPTSQDESATPPPSIKSVAWVDNDEEE